MNNKSTATKLRDALNAQVFLIDVGAIKQSMDEWKSECDKHKGRQNCDSFKFASRQYNMLRSWLAPNPRPSNCKVNGVCKKNPIEGVDYVDSEGMIRFQHSLSTKDGTLYPQGKHPSLISSSMQGHIIPREGSVFIKASFEEVPTLPFHTCSYNFLSSGFANSTFLTDSGLVSDVTSESYDQAMSFLLAFPQVTGIIESKSLKEILHKNAKALCNC